MANISLMGLEEIDEQEREIIFEFTKKYFDLILKIKILNLVQS
jgi:hypothetical protein